MDKNWYNRSLNKLKIKLDLNRLKKMVVETMIDLHVYVFNEFLLTVVNVIRVIAIMLLV